MIENIKNLTSDFLENEKNGLVKEVGHKEINYGDDQYNTKEPIIVETVNNELLNQRQLETSEISITTNKIDFSGLSPKRYTTTCHIEPKTIPYWYQESVMFYINSTKRHYEDKVFFKDKLVPVRWSEKMSTEVSFPDDELFYASVEIPVDDIYIPLTKTIA